MSRVIVLHGCRHGIGCSHLAANLAVMLMQRGYRVGLLDTDPRSGGVRTLLGLDITAERSMSAYWWLDPNPKLAKTLRAEWRFYSISADTTHPGIYIPPVGGQFVPESPQFQALQRHYNQTTAHGVLTCLSQDLRLDYVLIDNQPEMNDDNLLVLSLADLTVVMMQLDAYDFQKTAIVLDIIKRLETEQVWLVPTIVSSEIELQTAKRTIKEQYNCPVPGVLHVSEEMLHLASAGIFCLHYPTHSLTQTISAIADKLEHAMAHALPVLSAVSSPVPLFGLSKEALLSLLELSAIERQLLQILLRQGPLHVERLTAQMDAAMDEVMAGLRHLQQHGWIAWEPDSQTISFTPPT